jgi:hypothetical protein
MLTSVRLQQTLKNNAWILNFWAVTAAFGTYFSMYMFRKPFTAAAYDQEIWTDWDQKTILVSAQVIGYLISKLIGVRIVSEVSRGQRAAMLIGLIGCSHLALLLFAVVPPPFHILAIFANGLPLGMVFGLVLGFLEGRRMTEALTAGLCASFILAGGFSKTIGQWVLAYTTETLQFTLISAERWMPFYSGLLFVLPLLGSVWMLAQVPSPSDQDIAERSERNAMSRSDRLKVLATYGIGIASVAVVYFLTTILRSLRDDFAPEILLGMGATVKPSAFATIDLCVATVVLLANGMSVLVRDNKRALMFSFGVCFTGFIMILGSLVLQGADRISPVGFMVMVGAGLYLPYVAVHTTVFERMIAVTRDRGNIGFLMYVVDSLGYCGYVAIMIFKNFLPKSDASSASQILSGFRWTCWISAFISMFFVVVAAVYFSRLNRSTVPLNQPAKNI